MKTLKQMNNQDDEIDRESISSESQYPGISGTQYRQNDKKAIHYPNSAELDNYQISQNMLPDRFDRYNSDLARPMILIAVIMLAIDAFFLALLIMGGDMYLTPPTWDRIMIFTLLCFLYPFSIFWVNYKVHGVLTHVLRIVFNLEVLKRNAKYYSGLEIPDFFIQSKEYPHITIQIPVYKESLENTIIPTLTSCLREAKRYSTETGSKCNIVVCDDGYNLLSEDERAKRFLYYSTNNIAFTARPHPAKLVRNGRFKKAGNLNFSMNFSNLLDDIVSQDDATAEESIKLKAKKDELMEMGTQWCGDIRYGSLIFLVDSDTRLPSSPSDENGCMKRLAKEFMFDGEEVLYLQCFTGPYLSVKSTAEKSIFHHTCSIYNAISIGCVHQSLAPLVGHNAMINKRAMSECAPVDDETGFLRFWAEDRISEDFDLMMRGAKVGYLGRYATYAGIFLEGISFSYMTEYFKLSKFACGAAEMIYNPVQDWWRLGILSNSLYGLVVSDKVEWYNKMNMLSYTINFLALAMAPYALIYNIIFCEQLVQVLPMVLMPVNIMWETTFVYMVLTPFLNYLYAVRLGFDKWIFLKQAFRESLFLTSMYGSISVKMSFMCFAHLFNLKMSFGATQKDDEKITLIDWIRSTPLECTIYTLIIALIVVRLLMFTAPANISFVIYYGCTPALWNIFLFWAGPLLFDILPSKVDKTGKDYDTDDKMFVDKYQTCIPHSASMKKLDIGSKVKINPEDKEGNGISKMFSMVSEKSISGTEVSSDSGSMYGTSIRVPQDRSRAGSNCSGMDIENVYGRY